jgi:hypothetical protein
MLRLITQSPKPWQLFFQDPVNVIMNSLIDLHHDIMLFLNFLNTLVILPRNHSIMLFLNFLNTLVIILPRNHSIMLFLNFLNTLLVLSKVHNIMLFLRFLNILFLPRNLETLTLKKYTHTYDVKKIFLLYIPRYTLP